MTVIVAFDVRVCYVFGECKQCVRTFERLRKGPFEVRGFHGGKLLQERNQRSFHVGLGE